MDLSLHRLRMLREVADHDGVTAAARALQYSPSGVSQQLSALEAEVGAPLLERAGRGIRLTEVGRVLAEHARILLDAEVRARADVEQVRDSLAVELVIGVFSTVAAGLIPRLLSDIAERHPEIRLKTRQVDPAEAIVSLRHGHLDLALVLDYPDAPEAWPTSLTVVRAGSDKLHLAAPTGQFDGSPVRLAELADRDWVISGPHTYYGRAIRAACFRAGFEPRIAHQVDEQATALAMVAAGLGITLVSDLGRVFRPANVEVSPLSRPIKRQLLVAHHPEAAQRPAVKVVITSVKRTAATL
jgi:DNA-binding transcriptional LysR family regulator